MKVISKAEKNVANQAASDSEDLENPLPSSKQGKCTAARKAILVIAILAGATIISATTLYCTRASSHGKETTEVSCSGGSAPVKARGNSTEGEAPLTIKDCESHFGSTKSFIFDKSRNPADFCHWVAKNHSRFITKELAECFSYDRWKGLVGSLRIQDRAIWCLRVIRLKPKVPYDMAGMFWKDLLFLLKRGSNGTYGGELYNGIQRDILSVDFMEELISYVRETGVTSCKGMVPFIMPHISKQTREQYDGLVLRLNEALRK